MSEPVRVNQSAFRSFKRCRRRWWLGYYRGLRLATEKSTGNLSIGNKVHDALSLLEAGWTLGEVIELVRARYAEVFVEHPELGKELNSEAELVRLMIEGFVEWAEETGLAEDLEVYATEALMEFPILVDGTTVVLHGTIDARVLRRSTGARLLREYKTVGDLGTSMLHLDEQHLFYQLLERLHVAVAERGGAEVLVPPVEGSLHVMLRKVKRTASAKPPFYGVSEVHHSDEELRSMWKRVVGMVRDMLAVMRALADGEDPLSVCYPNPTRDCKWDCEWFNCCQMFDDGSDVETVLAEIYDVRPDRRREVNGEESA